MGRFAVGALLALGCSSSSDGSPPPSADASAGGSGYGGSGSTSCNNNNTLDPGEMCDGSQLNGETCQSLTMGTRPGGQLKCSSSCNFDTSGCLGGQGGSSGGGGTTGGGATTGQ